MLHHFQMLQDVYTFAPLPTENVNFFAKTIEMLPENSQMFEF